MKDNPSARFNDYHLVVFDPGGTTGWAHFVVDAMAFSAPNEKVMRWLYAWNCGEFTGTEHDQLAQAVRLIRDATDFNFPYRNITHAVAEDFELTQLIGGKNLLSPVRINAVLAWECAALGIELQMQKRAMRTSITKERLALFGFDGKFRKDEFSAMQHGVTWLRRIKQQANAKPWKLSDAISTNAPTN